MKEIRTHDTINRQHDVTMGSEKSFGIVFAVVFGLIGLFPLLHGGDVRLWSMTVAAVFLAAAYAKPDVLAPLNKLWFKLGLLLHKIVSPIIMGAVFLLGVVPTGLIRRAMGKDSMRLKKPEGDTYWIKRDPPGPDAESYKRQF
ncbi:MAG: hypothetical protein H6867_04505 [Rhodospirillales bacterium]|nr:hypothetical protein [Rhodospirillales bacterium]MCB9996412.1 hypothetical protein [Rhodospirillales bacterium]